MPVEYSKGKAEVLGVEIGPKDVKHEKVSHFERWKTGLTQSPWKWVTLICVIVIVIAVILIPVAVMVHSKGGRIENTADYWSNWMSFSTCSRSCGGGTKNRMRLCKGLNSSRIDVGCPRNDTETQTCNTFPCPVNGGWGDWASITECSQPCGGRSQTFLRECDNPIPAHGGDTCVGNKQETRTCNTKDCPVHGSWGEWIGASECSKTCGGGTIYRVRNCDNPAPTYDGKWCSGNASDFQQCNSQTCADTMSAFTAVYPSDGSASGTIKLDTEVTNIGGDYNKHSGQFICQHPGIYVFNLNIFKDFNKDQAYCYIQQSGNGKIRTKSNPHSSSDGGLYESSNSVILHLYRGDRVDLGSCSKANTMYYWTSFSGFLLKAD